MYLLVDLVDMVKSMVSVSESCLYKMSISQSSLEVQEAGLFKHSTDLPHSLVETSCKSNEKKFYSFLMSLYTIM